MTISSTQSSQTFLGTGSVSVFSFVFVADAAADIIVIYTNAAGVQTTLSPSQYTLSINSVPVGGLWGVGGTLIYPIVGSPIATGTSLTIQRVLPLQQLTTISNQGSFNPQVIETALDTLCMEIQQVAARSGQFRGIWITGASYNYADLVQDGVNGGNSLSYYFCTNANTSGVWATDLANGDWVLAIPSTIPVAALPLAISNGGTGQITAGAALNALGGISLSGNNTFTGTNSFTGGSIAVPTASLGDNTSKAASTGFVTTNFAPLNSPTFTGTPLTPTPSAGTVTTQIINAAYTIGGLLNNVQVFTSSGTYMPTAGTSAAIIFNQGAGGGGAGGGTSSGNGGAGGTTSVGSLASATGGGGGAWLVGGGGLGGAGGAGSLGILNLQGNAGGNAGNTNTAVILEGAIGGGGFFGGSGRASNGTGAGGAGGINSGGGGGGGGTGTASAGAGGGGGAGGLSMAYVTGLSGTYSVTIGASGTAGNSGGTGFAGGIGGSGVVLILEYK